MAPPKRRSVAQGGWTQAEDAEFLRLLAEGEKTLRAIAAELEVKFQRPFSKASVDHRARRIRATAKPCTGPAATPDCEIPVEWDDEGYVPNPPRGPQDKPHYIPNGHELAGVSRLKDKDGETIHEWDKTRVAGADNPPTPVPLGFLQKRSSVMQRGDGSTVVQWTSYEREEVERWEAIKSAIAEHVAEYVRPVAPVEGPATCNDDLLTVYPYGDPHMGMLAWAEEVGHNHDLKIAERELCECSRQLVERSPASGRALVLNLGDFWHSEDNTQRTPKSGHKLDVDGRAGKVGRVGLRVFQTIIDTALTKHPIVDVFCIPGNHDPGAALWLMLCMQALYAKEPRVIVHDGFNPYQYFAFGKVLLGMCHGDGAKIEALGEIMATDVPELWGAAQFREWHGGHIHHLVTKELRGCVVHTHRTLAPRDAWHHHAGYRSGQSLKSMTYHREWGLDSVSMVGIERVRAAISQAA